MDLVKEAVDEFTDRWMIRPFQTWTTGEQPMDDRSLRWKHLVVVLEAGDNYAAESQDVHRNETWPDVGR